MSNLVMSLEMSVFNRALKWAKASGLTDVARVNRALGLVKKEGALAEAIEKYGTTLDLCECKDAEFGPFEFCKHRVAVMMDSRIQDGVDEWLAA